ncbi:GNAT family N-acetyltransferase [Actinomadura opuntiae]|uniref:GNAT family N-acetyltransferase n=1 Tax=Actinomadura sp. OS1-43 TaxID=604315 RepID=UPI00255A7F97|nr:GNAT family N-acetyltransferase [Actinomadura sp. OS1-43]MDL4820589.1 GNAT family N-acetyltransferase [Actinomadura sp. OS1-43]
MTTVRLLEVEDWSLYRSVRLASLADAPEAFCSTLAREEAFAPEVWRERVAARNTYLAETEDGPGGVVAVVPGEDGAAELVGMWVAPAARGRGVGDLLVRAALDWTAERGLSELRLWVVEGNSRAERLYARHGFARTGVTQPHRPGEKQFEMAHVLPRP